MAGRLVCRLAAAPWMDGGDSCRGLQEMAELGGAVLWWNALSGRIGQGQPLRALRGVKLSSDTSTNARSPLGSGR